MKSYIFPLLFSLTAFTLSADVPGSAEKTEPLKVGAAVPDSGVRTLDGDEISLKKLVEGKPTVLVFYRGGWCPYCVRHLSALQEVEKDIEENGWQMIAVSPDKPSKLAATLDDKDLGYALISDSSMSAARDFGIAFQVDEETVEKYKGYGIDLVESSGESHKQLPVPSVFLINKEGKIQYVYTNPDYKKRLSAEDLLKELNK
jgi:peroxiredoxin